MGDSLTLPRYPFQIHMDLNPGQMCMCGCGKVGSENAKQYPTHTHGLERVGWPEILVDYWPLRNPINGYLLNASYDFLRQEPTAFKAILEGDAVKVALEEVMPDVCEEHKGKVEVLYHLADRNSRMMRRAYKGCNTRGMKFIAVHVVEKEWLQAFEHQGGRLSWVRLDGVPHSVVL